MKHRSHIAFEISPLLASSGERGEKSGLYRSLHTSILTSSIGFIKKKIEKFDISIYDISSFAGFATE